MKLMVDARYTRIGFHDGISRYTASLLGALKTLIDTGDEAAADLDLTIAGPDAAEWSTIAQAFAGAPGPGRTPSTSGDVAVAR